jgi:hypothetical protein
MSFPYPSHTLVCLRYVFGVEEQLPREKFLVRRKLTHKYIFFSLLTQKLYKTGNPSVIVTGEQRRRQRGI